MDTDHQNEYTCDSDETPITRMSINTQAENRVYRVNLGELDAFKSKSAANTFGVDQHIMGPHCD